VSVRCLMVDVDGVIVHPKYPGGWAERLEADLGLAVGDLGRFFFAPHWQDVSLGRADLHDRLGPVLAEIAPHLTSRQVTDYWFAHDAQFDDQLLKDLAVYREKGLALHLATVQEHHRARYLWETLGLRDHFDEIHYSAGFGVGKPDPAFFRAVEARTGFAPAELLLIDDRVENVTSAQSCGWGGILWDGHQGLAMIVT
jgi:putative hydrolase of the HAD superfamily